MGKKFTSKRAEFLRKNDAFMDMVTGHMALDVERGLKSTSGMPVKTGRMKSSARHFRNNRGKFRIEVNAEYAATQEAGIRKTGKGAPTRRFQNYTTAGTGSGFFMRAVSSVLARRSSYIDEAAKALNL